MLVGILGGSFDPAHSGHVAISMQAIRRLNLHEIWWVIAKQNPLKDKPQYSIEERLALARQKVTRFRRIKVRTATQIYTLKELEYLKCKYSSYKLVWIMGLDCLRHLHKWYRFEELNNIVPMVIFNRGDLLHKAMRSCFILRFFRGYINNTLLKRRFYIMATKAEPGSSTLIRESQHCNKM